MPFNSAKLKTNDGTFHGKKIDAIIDVLRSLEVMPGRGYQLKKTSGGTVLDITPGKGGVSAPRPFTAISAGKNEDDSIVFIHIVPGTVSNKVPLEESTFYSTDSGYYEIPYDSTYYFYLRAHMLDTGIVDEADIIVSTSVPDNEAGDADSGAPPAYSYRTLAKVVTDADGAVTITNYLTGSQWVSLIVSNWGCVSITRNIVWSE